MNLSLPSDRIDVTTELPSSATECVKSGSTSVIELFVILLKMCFVISMVSADWASASMSGLVL